ncbi:MAG: PKD domain-containing protein [Pedosphaera sp.]|nr:PKD domain-containing protein [Pedosphaera sp.]
MSRFDDDGGVSSDQLVVTVNNVAPQNLNAGANRTVSEGMPVSFTGSFADTGSADTQTLTWQVVSTNGEVLPGESGATFTFIPSDDGTYTVTFTVKDDDGGATSTKAIVTVNNIAPTAAAGADQTVNEGDRVTLIGGVTDPSNRDTFTFRWHVVSTNGEVIPDGSGQNFTFRPGDNGIYTVTFTVQDDNNGSRSDEMVVTVNNVAPEQTLALIKP